MDIDLRGRPIREVSGLINRHLPLANMRFDGPYAQADLASIYGNCDFAWAVEYRGENVQECRLGTG